MQLLLFSLLGKELVSSYPAAAALVAAVAAVAVVVAAAAADAEGAMCCYSPPK